MRFSGLLLTALALLWGGSAVAQQASTELIPENTQGIQRHFAAPSIESTEFKLPYVNYASNAAVEFRVIDSLFNGFSYYTLQQQPITYEATSNLTATIKRAGAGASSGDIYIRVSSDRGATWGPEIGPLPSDASVGGGRYPSIALANPGGSTDPSEVFMVYSFPALVPGAGFGNLAVGIATADGTSLPPFTLLPISGGVDGSLWGSSNEIALVNGDQTAIIAGSIGNDNFGIIILSVTNGTATQKIPSSLAGTNFRAGTAEGRYSSLAGIDGDANGNAYIGIHAWSDETTPLRPGVTKSTDGGETWSPVNFAPRQMFVDFIRTAAPGAEADSIFIDYDSDFQVIGEDQWSFLTNLYYQDRAKDERIFVLVEVLYENGGWGIRDVAEISGSSPLFFHDGSGTGTSSQTGNEIALAATADGSKLIAKWIEFRNWVSATDITGDGMAPDTVLTTDVYYSGRAKSATSWTAPTNITESLMWDKLSWIPDELPNDLQRIPLLTVQTKTDASQTSDSARLLYAQRNMINPQYVTVAQFNASVTSSVENNAVSREAIAMTVSPNPTTDRAEVTFVLPTAGTTTVELFNVMGERVMSLSSEALPAGRHSLPLDVSRLEAGVYYCNVRSGGTVSTSKLTVVR